MTESPKRVGFLSVLALALVLATGAIANDDSDPVQPDADTAVKPSPALESPPVAPATQSGLCKAAAAQAVRPLPIRDAIICVCDKDSDCSAKNLCGDRGGICEITTPCEEDPRGSCFCGQTRDGSVLPAGR